NSRTARSGSYAIDLQFALTSPEAMPARQVRGFFGPACGQFGLVGWLIVPPFATTKTIIATSANGVKSLRPLGPSAQCQALSSPLPIERTQLGQPAAIASSSSMES